MLWAAIAFSLVALTKYLTSVRLRTLFNRIQQDHQAAERSRYDLEQVVNKEQALHAQVEALAAKATALRIVVENLDRSCRESNDAPHEETPQ